jgi:spermidine synthase
MTVFSGIQIPKVTFETDSKYNGHIEVIEVGTVRKLKVNKVEQSVNHTSESGKRLFWGKVFDVIKEEEPNLKDVLILGLGGGTVAHLLADHYKDVAITSVDIDPVMIEIGKKYFDVDKIPNHTIIEADALRLVVVPEEFGLAVESFQVVYVDLFIGEKYPDLGSSGNFVAAVKRMVRPGGLLVFNRIYMPDDQDEVNTFVEYLENFLHNIKCVIVAGHTNSDNIVIYGRV